MGAAPCTEIVNIGGGKGCLREKVEENNSVLYIFNFEMPGSCSSNEIQWPDGHL